MEVAHSWHQPRKAETNSDDILDQSIDTSPLLKLNDDCLFAVFDLCSNQSLVVLAETCTRFNTLLINSYKFPKNRNFKLYGDDRRIMSLANVRKVVRLMGPYFHKLDLHLIDLQIGLPLRYFQIVMKYCKSNTFIRELKLEIEVWNEDFTVLVGPILKHLQALDLCICGTCKTVLPDFMSLCPNLKKIISNVFVAKFSIITMPSLESFSFDNVLEPDMLEFIAVNPQITVLKSKYVTLEDLQNIAIHLPNVQKLSFHLYEILGPNDSQHLKKFKHLTKLKLKFVPFVFQEMPIIILSETFECFRRFMSLSELKLYFKDRTGSDPVLENQRSITALSGMLPNLERFDLVGLKLLDSTVVDFVRLAEKLKSLHLHIVDIYANGSLITKLVALRKSRQQDKLNLFLDKDFRNNEIVINAAFVQDYLSVKWNCAHDLSCD